MSPGSDLTSRTVVIDTISAIGKEYTVCVGSHPLTLHSEPTRKARQEKRGWKRDWREVQARFLWAE